jgi:hypothetical protein
MASEGEEARAVEEEPPEVHWVNEGVGQFSQHRSAVRASCCCRSIVAFEASRMVVGATYTQVPPSSRPPWPSPTTPPSILHSGRHAQRMAPAEGEPEDLWFFLFID